VKKNLDRQEGCSSAKWVEQHWWLLVHSSHFSFQNLVFWNLFEFSVAEIT
jgi:hypothetical protein